MIVRVVQLVLTDDKVKDLFHLLDQYQYQIRNAPGCLHLEILQDIDQPSKFITYSHWKSEQHLNEYRSSALFGVVWPAIKACLKEKPRAQSFDRKINII
ncbi:MAG: antibiotic biosynthesis monooxygenase [Reichenbachiella sp.]